MQVEDERMQSVGLNELLEAGVHFGHQTRRWNPKMRQFIFAERNGIHIIDLRKTLDRMQVAEGAVRQIVLKGEKVLFVCTKRQLRGIVEQEAERCGAYYVTERWLGGMLTNFQTMRKQIRRLKELERGQEENAFEFHTKKERLLLERERIKLDKYLSGVKDMNRLPGAMFVVDARRELIAVREAHKLGIPIIAIADTNADPDLIDFPIPGNDDAIRSVSLITKAIGDTVAASVKDVPEEQLRRVAEMEATTYSTETGETKEADRPARRRPRRRKPRPEVIAAHAPGSPGSAEQAGDVVAAPAGAEVATDTPPITEGETVAADTSAEAVTADVTAEASADASAEVSQTKAAVVQDDDEAPATASEDEPSAAGEGDSAKE